MQLCFKAGNEGRKDMFELLQKITDGLTSNNNNNNTNPQVILNNSYNIVAMCEHECTHDLLVPIVFYSLYR
jgi:hypothetical protein